MKARTGRKEAPISALYAQPDITGRGNFSKSHLYNMVSRGQFPTPALRCGPRFTRWCAAEVDAWFADPAGWIAAHKTLLASGAGDSQ
jgi:predicted DNA-binding transcriptional regulator AlpA